MKTNYVSPLPIAPAACLRAIIVDDEPAARHGVRHLLERDPAVEIVGEASGGFEALELIRITQPAIAFLDGQTPGCDGFEVLAQLPPAAVSAVVFVTAYDEHALRAFEVNAVDYLLKPYDDARFSAALQRAKEEVRRRQSDTVNSRLTQLLDYLQQTPPATVAPKDDPAGGRILVKSSGEIFS